MAKWNALRATFPEDELEEIERIKNQYQISYNEIIRAGVKFYVGLTLLKELFATTTYGKAIKINNIPLEKHLNNPVYQANIDQKITKLVKMVMIELVEKGIDFEEKTRTIRKERKVGRPKKVRKVGRPSQYE